MKVKTSLYDLLWAKTPTAYAPGKSLLQHCKEVGYTAGVIIDDSTYADEIIGLSRALGISKKSTIKLVQYLAAMHDIGKAAPSFFRMSHEPKVAKFIGSHASLFVDAIDDYRHEIGSGLYAYRIWKEAGMFSEQTRKTFRTALRFHHQGRQGTSQVLDASVKRDREWIDAQNRLEEELRKEFKPPMKVSVVDNDTAGFILTSVIQMADWIASGKKMSKEGMKPAEIKKKAKEFIRDIGMHNREIPEAKTFSKLWDEFDAKHMRPLQSSVQRLFSKLTQMPLLTILEAACGEGKTEAGLYVAYKMAEYFLKTGIYFALPTAATANGMDLRMRLLLARKKITSSRLVHSTSWQQDVDMTFFDEDHNEISETIESEEWFRTNRQSLLANNAVGTIDQIMMATLRVKYANMRLFGLTNKVIILDEVHAYDAYMTSVIKKLLMRAKDMRIPVVIMSATLPQWKKEEFIQVYSPDVKAKKIYPAISMAFEDGTVEQHRVMKSHKRDEIQVDLRGCLNDPQEIARLAVKEVVADGGCAAVIMNTIKEAQAVYGEVKKILPKEAGLFHARFTAEQRESLERDCMDFFGTAELRPDCKILVATQVIEQSLDLDFDYMISAIAPVDLIIQRAGRLFRHEETVRPKGCTSPRMTIVCPNGKDTYTASAGVYYKLLLDRTIEILGEKKSFKVPEDTLSLIEYVYDKDVRDEDDINAFLAAKENDELLKSIGTNLELPPPNKKKFCLSRPNNELIKGDDDSMQVSVATRISEPSCRIAILPKKLYKEAERLAKADAIPTETFSKEVFRKVVSFPESMLSIDETEDDVVVLRGRLSGIKILKAVKTRAGNLSALHKDKILTCDKEYGLMIYG